MAKRKCLVGDPGLRQFPCRIEYPDETTKDAYGNPGAGWIAVGSTFASADPLTGRELVESQKVHGEVTHKVRLIPPVALTPKHRLVIKGRILGITAVLAPFVPRVEVDVLCTEVAI